MKQSTNPSYPSDENIRKLLESKSTDDIAMGISFLYKKLKGDVQKLREFLSVYEKTGVSAEIYIGNINITVRTHTGFSVYSSQPSPNPGYPIYNL